MPGRLPAGCMRCAEFLVHWGRLTAAPPAKPMVDVRTALSTEGRNLKYWTQGCHLDPEWEDLHERWECAFTIAYKGPGIHIQPAWESAACSTTRWFCMQTCCAMLVKVVAGPGATICCCCCCAGACACWAAAHTARRSRPTTALCVRAIPVQGQTGHDWYEKVLLFSGQPTTQESRSAIRLLKLKTR